MLPEFIIQVVGQLKKKEAFPEGPLVGCLLGLGTTAAAYAEEPGYRMCTRDFIQMGNKPVLPILSWE